MIILDNSVLSTFTRIENIEVVRELFREIIIPISVSEEYLKNKDAVDITNWVKVTKLNDDETLKSNSLRLGVSESQSIILALRYKCILGIDDRVSRDIAKKQGLDVIGSMGILRLAYESGLI